VRAALLPAILIIFLSPQPSVAQLDKCTMAALPKSIADEIQNKYPGWRPERISDLGADDQQLWNKAHHDLCPGIASGHFKSASRTDYAVLLLSKERSRAGYKFLLFIESRLSPTFNSILLDHGEGNNAGQPVISRVPPGKYSDPESGKSVKTKLDSVLIEWIEAAAQLYFWRGSKYQKLQVQD
jgi:hypothetical protein